MAAQGAFGTDFYDRSTRTIVGTMLWTENRSVIKIGPKGALGSHANRPIHSAPRLGQSIVIAFVYKNWDEKSNKTIYFIYIKTILKHFFFSGNLISITSPHK